MVKRVRNSVGAGREIPDSGRKQPESSQTWVFLVFDAPSLAERPVEPAGLFYCGIVHVIPVAMNACIPSCSARVGASF